MIRTTGSRTRTLHEDGESQPGAASPAGSDLTLSSLVSLAATIHSLEVPRAAFNYDVKNRQQVTRFSNDAVDVVGLRPKDEVTSLRVVVSPHVQDIHWLDKNSKIAVGEFTVTRFVPPSVNSLIKMLEVVPHVNIVERRVVLHPDTCSHGFSLLGKLAALAPEYLSSVGGCIKQALQGEPHAVHGGVTASATRRAGFFTYRAGFFLLLHPYLPCGRLPLLRIWDVRSVLIFLAMYLKAYLGFVLECLQSISQVSVREQNKPKLHVNLTLEGPKQHRVHRLPHSTGVLHPRQVRRRVHVQEAGDGDLGRMGSFTARRVPLASDGALWSRL